MNTSTLSECRRYRYDLWRILDSLSPKKTVTFVMLNPSTADATSDDPTVRKCIGFAERWQCTALSIVNLFAWRETNPQRLVGHTVRGEDTVGPENDRHIRGHVIPSHTNLVVEAWGANVVRYGDVLGYRARIVHRMLVDLACEKLFCLGRTKDGAPRHPLMLPYSTELEAVRE